MATQFLRIVPVGASAIGEGRLSLHVRGKTRHEYTRLYAPYAGRPPVHLTPDMDSVAAILLQADRESRKSVRGPKGKPFLDVLICGPPRYDSEEMERNWLDVKELDWAYACVDWLCARMAEGNVLAHAELHRDEASPHIHAVIVPWNPHTLRMDVPRLRTSLAGHELASRLSKRELVKTSRATLDRFHKEVNEKFGIERGEPGSVRGSWALDRRVTMELDEKGAREKAQRETARVQRVERKVSEDAKVWSTAAGLALERKQAAEQALADAEEEVKKKRKEVADLQGDYQRNVKQVGLAAQRAADADQSAEARVKLAENLAKLAEDESRARRRHADERAEMIAVVRQSRKYMPKHYADLIRNSVDAELVRLGLPVLKEEEIGKGGPQGSLSR